TSARPSPTATSSRHPPGRRIRPGFGSSWQCSARRSRFSAMEQGLHLKANKSMTLRALRAWRVTLCALGTLLASPTFADTTTDLIKSLQLVAEPAPVKQRSDWRVPQKVMLLEFGKQDWAPREAQFAAAAPQT